MTDRLYGNVLKEADNEGNSQIVQSTDVGKHSRVTMEEALYVLDILSKQSQ